jgi:hypothetical protein
MSIAASVVLLAVRPWVRRRSACSRLIERRTPRIGFETRFVRGSLGSQHIPGRSHRARKAIGQTRRNAAVLREIHPPAVRSRHPKDSSISNGDFSPPVHGSWGKLPCSTFLAFHGGWTNEAHCLVDLPRTHPCQPLWLPPLPQKAPSTSQCG